MAGWRKGVHGAHLLENNVELGVPTLDIIKFRSPELKPDVLTTTFLATTFKFPYFLKVWEVVGSLPCETRRPTILWSSGLTGKPLIKASRCFCAKRAVVIFRQGLAEESQEGSLAVETSDPYVAHKGIQHGVDAAVEVRQGI